MCAPSPPVPTMSTQASGSSHRRGLREHRRRPARRPRRATRPWRAARRRSAATCAGVASPVMISRIAQAVSAAVRSSRGQQPGQQGRPGRCGGRRAGGHRRRGPPDARVAQQVGHDAGRGQRVDREGQGGLGPRPVRQPAVGLAGDEHAHRRAVGHLLLELAGQRQAAGGLRLAVEEQQVDPAAVDGGDHLVAGRALEPGERARRRRPDGGRPPCGRRPGPRTGGCRPARWPVRRARVRGSRRASLVRRPRRTGTPAPAGSGRAGHGEVTLRGTPSHPRLPGACADAMMSP